MTVKESKIAFSSVSSMKKVNIFPSLKLQFFVYFRFFSDYLIHLPYKKNAKYGKIIQDVYLKNVHSFA